MSAKLKDSGPDLPLSPRSYVSPGHFWFPAASARLKAEASVSRAFLGNGPFLFWEKSA